jgi:hypothetical protein
MCDLIAQILILFQFKHTTEIQNLFTKNLKKAELSCTFQANYPTSKISQKIVRIFIKQTF